MRPCAFLRRYQQVLPTEPCDHAVSYEGTSRYSGSVYAMLPAGAGGAATRMSTAERRAASSFFIFLLLLSQSGPAPARGCLRRGYFRFSGRPRTPPAAGLPAAPRPHGGYRRCGTGRPLRRSRRRCRPQAFGKTGTAAVGGPGRHRARTPLSGPAHPYHGITNRDGIRSTVTAIIDRPLFCRGRLFNIQLRDERGVWFFCVLPGYRHQGIAPAVQIAERMGTNPLASRFRSETGLRLTDRKTGGG